MATTKTPQAALDWAQRFIKKVPTQDIAVDIANAVHAKMWQAANWNWSVNSVAVSLTPASASVSQQDYNLTNAVSSTENLTDCARFIKGFVITPMQSTGVRTDQYYELEPVSHIPILGEAKGVATSFQYIPNTNPTPDKVRMDVSILYPTGSKFYGVYKKNITLFTPQTLQAVSSIAFPDDWYYVYQEGVLYYYYKYADDDRAGGARVSIDGKEEYSGQLAAWMDGINDMKKNQPLLYLDFKRAQERKE